MERAPIWASSVESLKEAGIVDYFFQLSQSKSDELVPRGSTSAKSSGHARPDMDQDEGLFLRDAVAGESFVVLLYGICVATAVFFVEVVMSIRFNSIHLSQ